VVGVIGIEKHPQPVSLESEPVQFTPELLLASEPVIARLQERKSIWDKLELKEESLPLRTCGCFTGISA